MKVVLASNNQKKIKEMRELLLPFGMELCTQREAGVLGEAEETGETFLENARLKARYALERTGLAAVADDSGLMVDALHGRPGVYSARYAGGDDAAGIRRLLSELDGVPEERRTARFCSAIVCLLPDGREISAEGVCEGVITAEPSGAGGFGYDPVFFVPEAEMTFAEMPPEMKNRLSHRGRAMAAFRKKLEQAL